LEGRADYSYNVPLPSRLTWRLICKRVDFLSHGSFQRCSEAQVDVTVLVSERVGVPHLKLETRGIGGDGEDHLSRSRYTGIHVLQEYVLVGRNVAEGVGAAPLLFPLLSMRERDAESSVTASLELFVKSKSTITPGEAWIVSGRLWVSSEKGDT
jgi:hypothetical protein